MRTTAKVSIGLGMLFGLVIATPVAAQPNKPIGGCPKGFALVALEDLNLGELTGVPSIGGNNDGYTCFKPLDLPQNEEFAILIDNRVRQ